MRYCVEVHQIELVIQIVPFVVNGSLSLVNSSRFDPRLFWQVQYLRSRASAYEASRDVLLGRLIVINLVGINNAANQFGPIPVTLLEYELSKCRILIGFANDRDNIISAGNLIELQ